MKSFDQILKFVDLIHQFRAVERMLLVKDSERRENDVEHSFSLAMLSWYINSTYKLGLNTDKLFKYALAHDLVEVFAGDTYYFHKDQSVLDSKQKREEEAAEILKAKFPEFPELHEIIHEYEKRKDDESKFVYALDKVEPVLSIYRDGGRTWKKNKVTLDMLKTMKIPKVAIDKNIAEIFQELVERLEREHEVLFNK
ncbi:MAG: HD domain-containing protein [bacterium]